MSVSATTVGWGLAAAFIGYLLGAIPVGVIVARVSGIDDPRTHDSTHIYSCTIGIRCSQSNRCCHPCLALLART